MSSTPTPNHNQNTTIKKLYWIVCDDKDHNLFEGRYQGRTRGEAMKFISSAPHAKVIVLTQSDCEADVQHIYEKLQVHKAPAAINIAWVFFRQNPDVADGCPHLWFPTDHAGHPLNT